MKPHIVHFAPILPVLLLSLVATLAAGDEWRADLLRQRAAKDREFRTSPTSPLAGVARLNVAAGSRRTPVAGETGITLAEPAGPDAPGALFQQGDRWFRTAQPPAAAVPLNGGDTWKTGRFVLMAYPAADALTLLVFDPQRPTLRHFRHLRYFPPARKWAVRATLERLAEPAPVRMLTSRNLQKPFFRYGLIHFRAGNRELILAAFKSSLQGEGAAELFIPFKDLGNGKATYEAGRFLDVSEPAGTELVLDFNTAYNPLCNYSPAYNCPMPPRENFLEIAVPAGEKTYPHEKEQPGRH
jgi:uncharacterized protein